MSIDSKDACERCDKALASAAAFACSHSCTFCERCTAEMSAICPNCGGALTRR